MIKIKNITKTYDYFLANNDISLTINKGEIFGIIGPNGAGKTTLINQILGFIKPTSGEITVNEFDAWNDRIEITKSVGFIPGELALFDHLRMVDLVKVYQKFITVDEEFLQEVVKYLEIETNIKIKKLSKGNKQKVAIALALLSKPKLLVLDEPTTGLDPVMQENFGKILLKLKGMGSTIILCTHIYQEVLGLCDKVAMLKNGELIDELTLDEKGKKNFLQKTNELYAETKKTSIFESEEGSKNG